MKRIILALILGASALACGCNSPIAFTDQEARVRYNPSDDSLDLLLVYRGITATSDDADVVAKALDEHLVPILNRRREFVIQTMGYWNLDAEKDGKEDLRALRAAESFKLEEVATFLDDERLAGFQHFKIMRVSDALRDWNQMLSESILEQAKDGRLSEGDLDARSLELCVARARSGQPWVRLVEGEFEIDLPLTRATSRKLQQKVLVESIAGSDKPNWIAKAFSYVTSLRIEDERFVVRLGRPENGLYTFAFSGDKTKDDYSPKLLEALRDRGYAPNSDLNLESVRAKLAGE
jgi:hypothetical protein